MKSVIKVTLVVVTIAVVTFFGLVLWSEEVAAYSPRQLVDDLETGRLTLWGDNIRCKPKRVYPLSDQEGNYFVTFLCESRSETIIIYLGPDTSTNRVHGKQRSGAFAAHLLGRNGVEKWYFCDTNTMDHYLSVSLDHTRR